MFVAAEMSDEQFAAIYDSNAAWKLHNRDLSRGEIACALSHQSALREFLKTEDSCCMIVEDDVLFSPVIGDFLDGLHNWMARRGEKPTCAVLSEAAAVRYWAARRWIGEIRRTRPIDIYGAIAYVVNRAGAESILRVNAVPIHMESDYWSFYRKCGLSVFGVDKILAGSFDFSREDSSLSKDRAETHRKNLAKRVHDSFFKRKMKALAYYAKRLWWRVTGVDTKGKLRTNVGLYRACDRLTECSNN
jgi:glycosyl transferase family 25